MRPSQGDGQSSWGQPAGGRPPQNPSGGPAPWGRAPVWGTPPGGQPAWGTPPGGQPAWGTPPPNPNGGLPPYNQRGYAAPPKPGIVPLRPLMFGEILDGSFQAIRGNAKAMLGAALLVQSIAAVVAAVLTTFTATSAASIETWAAGLTDQDLISFVLSFAGGILLVSVLTLFLSAVLQGAMVVPLARAVLNRSTGFGQMWKLARSRVWPLIRLAALLFAGGLLAVLLFAALAVLLISTVGAAGALVLIPLGLLYVLLFIWIYIKLMVAPAVVVVEELGALDSLSRSWQLTRNNWWRLLGITLVVSIMVGVIAQVVMIPVSLLSSFYTTVVSPHGGSEQALMTAIVAGVATAVIGALVGAVGFAFQTSVMALLYLDLRMRWDGLDIALLRQLESGADPDGVPGRGVPVYRTGPGNGPGNGQGNVMGNGPRPPYGAWPNGR
ncbi:hypothetical protein [Arthrobacter sp. 754]|uniref:DUF7847 domain-containing protein n=1 Tax=Arthrobacter sp. 754 TaxID=3156315 RepID=UPI0033946889